MTGRTASEGAAPLFALAILAHRARSMVQIHKTPLDIKASIMVGRGHALDEKESDSDGELLERRFRYQEAC